MSSTFEGVIPLPEIYPKETLKMEIGLFVHVHTHIHTHAQNTPLYLSPNYEGKYMKFSSYSKLQAKSGK